jgi:hypothetical protein
MNRNSWLPVLEHLEARTLLATCHVTRLGDVGAGAGAQGDLRYCINQTNTEPGPDTITFTVIGTINLTSALPDLESDLTITGPGAGILTIHARQKARVFYVDEGANVQISDLTVTGGYKTDPDAKGGGIYNEGNLVLQSCWISGNTTYSSSYPLRDFAYGGGIYNAGLLAIYDSLILGNTARAPGGDNLYAYGGGIYNRDTLLITDSTIENNQAYSDFDFGLGGGIHNDPGGRLTLKHSTIARNLAYGWSSAGGGISTRAPANVTISNSTIAENRTDGIYPYGGGVWAYQAALNISHSTIAENGASGVHGHGGGIFTRGDSTHLYHTILASNRSRGGLSNDLEGPLAASTYNLIGNPTGGSGFNRDTDLLGIDPNLGPLQDNGGPTLTMALLPGSPAIDAGDPNPVDPPTWDQRGPGFPRIVNGRLDIGAFEVQAGGMPVPYYVLLLTADLDND